MITKLVLFSLSIQAAIGAMAISMITGRRDKENVFKGSAVAAIILSLVGFWAFLMYLGTPANVFNAFSRLGHSWLSRQVLCSVLFICLAALNIVAVRVKPQVKRFGWAAVIVGVLNVFIMVMVGRISNVPLWDSLAVFVDFFARTMLLGIMVLFLLDYRKLKSGQVKACRVLGLVLTVILLGTSAFYVYGLGTEGSKEIFLGQIFLLAGSLLLFALPGAKTGMSEIMHKGTQYLGAAALTGGLVVSRYMFYAIFMTIKGLG